MNSGDYFDVSRGKIRICYSSQGPALHIPPPAAIPTVASKLILESQPITIFCGFVFILKAIVAILMIFVILQVMAVIRTVTKFQFIIDDLANCRTTAAGRMHGPGPPGSAQPAGREEGVYARGRWGCPDTEELLCTGTQASQVGHGVPRQPR